MKSKQKNPINPKSVIVIKGGQVYQAFTNIQDHFVQIIDLDQMDDLDLREADEKAIEKMEKQGLEVQFQDFEH